ncbi:MAG: sporulation protein YtfJ [Ruminococcaceae bacterium]|jgi:sporulation protein YtfJ|nr:sporulation protein YtfJ [Oscillospiraceae bacterium]
MENSNISSLMETTMGKIREMVDVNTVVGSPITTPDGITVIPVSRISYAFATGGSDFRIKEKPGFGGGNGAGVKIEPIGFLIVKDGNVRMVGITPPANNTIDRVIEKAPELMDTLETFFKKRTPENAE